MHQFTFLNRYDVTKLAAPGATFLLNSPYGPDEVWRHLPAEVQRAVISHELFHVRRRDWAWLVGEELICALLWFNPAIWWAVSRVHDARELVVDELAVLATGRRRAYVEALMRFADETSLAPVAAFGGRRQLFHRIVMLSKERVMSSRRIVLTVGVMTLALFMLNLLIRRRKAKVEPVGIGKRARIAVCGVHEKEHALARLIGRSLGILGHEAAFEQLRRRPRPSAGRHGRAAWGAGGSSA